MALQEVYDRIDRYDDNSKAPMKQKVDFRGVTDWGNLLQFAPYESGYCFLVVVGAPTLLNRAQTNDGFEELQMNFIKILENEFKGLSGLEDWGVDTYTVGINNSMQTVISKVKGMSETQITMNFTEKTGTPITKYCMEYLRRVRNPYSEMASYNGATSISSNAASNEENYSSPDNGFTPYAIAQFKEVFTFLYIITDSTCLNVEKAFALINAKPMSAGYSELYNFDRGDITTKTATVTFSCSVREGEKINATASKFIGYLIETENNPDGLVKLNSNDYSYTLSGTGGIKTKAARLALGKKKDKEGYKYKWYEDGVSASKDGVETWTAYNTKKSIENSTISSQAGMYNANQKKVSIDSNYETWGGL